jgi:hypothetical protein
MSRQTRCSVHKDACTLPRTAATAGSTEVSSEKETNKMMLRKISALTTLGVALLFTFGCEEEKAPVDEKKEEVAVAAVPQKSDAEKLAEEKAAAEAAAKKAEEDAAAEAKLQEDPLTECCRALAQIAMFQRSAAHKAGETVCGAAMNDKKPFAEAVKEIESKLEGKPLPEPCKAK